ncbi:MAG TPA: hypothetical protein DEH78_05865 [Solibacterales bacterium]|nr:hypothetical protein [Bryobacterales bacterium]
MLTNFRQFTATDPFDRPWDVEFRWHQNGISIRHADTVDCKYWLTHEGEKLERVIALEHKNLLRLAAAAGRALTDAWVIKLAALHMNHMVTTWEDMEKVLVTVPYQEMERHNATLVEAAAEQEA